MEYVPIIPHGAEGRVKLPGDRLFCFADIAVKDKVYHDYYKNTQKEVLLDHPVYELEPALGVMETVSLIQSLEPDITTVPDKHEDYETTRSMFFEYAPAMRGRVPGLRLMGVPQGTTPGQILFSAQEMARSGLVDMLGIGIKRSIPDLDRAALIQQISSQFPRMRYHLLGARWPYLNEHEAAQDERVESLDSAEPVSIALKGRYFRDATAPDTKRRPDFHQTAELAVVLRGLIWDNSIDMHRVLNYGWHVILEE